MDNNNTIDKMISFIRMELLFKFLNYAGINLFFQIGSTAST